MYKSIVNKAAALDSNHSPIRSFFMGLGIDLKASFKVSLALPILHRARVVERLPKASALARLIATSNHYGEMSPIR